MNLPALTSLMLLLCISQGTDEMPDQTPGKQPGKQAAKQADKQPAKQSGKQSDKQADKQVEEKADKKADEQADENVDLDSVDTLVVALYDVISGPGGQKRDWKRFESLFNEGAKLQAMVMGRDGKRRLLAMTPKEYVKKSGQWAEDNGLWERETHRSQDAYGHITHVFSTYELRVGSADKEPDMTGINSIQCCQVEGKWRILSLLWEDARSAGPIPDRYRAKADRARPTKVRPTKAKPPKGRPDPEAPPGDPGPKKDVDDRKQR